MLEVSPEIVFFDIDQTLHRKETQFMPESAVEAIKALRKRGIHTAIATGRSPVSFPVHIRRLFEEEVIDVLVSINGQYNCRFENHQRVTLADHPLSPQLVQSLIAYLRTQNIDYAGISADAMAASAESERVDTALRGIAGRHIEPDYALNNTVYQMLVFVDEIQEKALLEQGIIDDSLEMIRWHPLCIDLLNRNGAKARGVRDVCEKMGIPLAKTMAFGDGLNDVEMMKTVGFGVAMGDGVEPVRKLAKYVTGTVEEHGIANALKIFGLI